MRTPASQITIAATFTLGTLGTLGAACTAVEQRPELGMTRQNITSANALSVNRLSMNRLSMNRLSMNRLSMNRLSMNGLLYDHESGEEGRSMIDMLHGNPDAVELMHYIVSCALPEGENVEIPKHLLGMEAQDDEDMYVFEGWHGLAPEWKSGECREPFTEEERLMAQSGEWEQACPRYQCDEVCQRWISACLFARANAVGVSVPISMRGPHPALATTDDELAGYPMQEGAFWGNFFDGSGMYACYGPYDDPDVLDLVDDVQFYEYVPSSSFRHCTRKGASCPMQIVGPCGAGPRVGDEGLGPADYDNPYANFFPYAAESGVLEVAAHYAVDENGNEYIDYGDAATRGAYIYYPGFEGPRSPAGVGIGITVYLQGDPGGRYEYDPEHWQQVAAEAGNPCGDGTCDFGEDASTCPADCSGYEPPPCEGEYCEE